MNSEKSKTSELQVLILKLTNKLDLRIDERLLQYQTLVYTTRGYCPQLYSRARGEDLAIQLSWIAP